jgi:hypothetical protein
VQASTVEAFAAYASIAVAAGTVGLAVATVFMASKTRKVAEETALLSERTLRLAEAAERDLEQGRELVVAARDQAATSLEGILAPWVPLLSVLSADDAELRQVLLKPAPADGQPAAIFGARPAIIEGNGIVWICLTLRNLGPGVAIMGKPEGLLPSLKATHAELVVSGDVSTRIVAPGDTVTLMFSGTSSDPSWGWFQQLTRTFSGPDGVFARVAVTYGDMTENRHYQTKLELAKTEAKTFETLAISAQRLIFPSSHADAPAGH